MHWLKKFIDYKGLSVLSFEKSIATRSAIDKAIKNSSNLRSSLLAKIIEVYPDIEPHWLLTGQGNMLKNNTKEVLEIKKTVTEKELQTVVDCILYNEDELMKNKIFKQWFQNKMLVCENKLLKEIKEKELLKRNQT